MAGRAKRRRRLWDAYIRGIGFKTADAIAMKLGIEKTSMIRVRRNFLRADRSHG
jgi:ribosomal protein S13